LLDQLRELLPVLARVLGVVLLLALVMVVVPLAGRRHREEGIRRAGSATQQVEGQWTLLVRSLQDLGVDEPAERSPREMRRHYSTETILNRQGEEALGRITTTLERSRYAPPTVVQDTDASRMGEDVRAVVTQVRHATPWNVRANAALLPRSGLDGLRAWVGGLFRR
jgi:hypothetical protein